MAYATDYTTGTIVQMDNDGNNISVIVSGTFGNPIFVEYSPELGKIYWTANGGIHRANSDGSSPEENIISDVSGYNTAIALDGPNGVIYYSKPAVANKELYRANADGSNQMLIASGVRADVLAIDQNNQHLYYLDSYKHLTRIDTDGSNKTLLLADAAGYAEDIELDLVNSKIYWSDSSSSKIYRSDMNGSGSEVVVTSATAWLLGIAVVSSSNKLYWTEWNPHLYRRSSLDGSNIETLAISANFWYDIFVLDEVSPVIFQESGNLFIFGSVPPVLTPSDEPLRIINRLVRAADYNPQLIGSFATTSVSANIEVWDVVDGQNIAIMLANSGCYAIGDTGKFGWSLEHLPFTDEKKKYHYYYRITSNEGEHDHGEFFIVVPERGRWSYPD